MSHANYSGPYYAHLIQTDKRYNPGEWGRWFVTAASREDMKTFFRGLQKYTQTSNPLITEVKPVNLAWWTFKSQANLGILELVKRIYQSEKSTYNNVEELGESCGKITILILPDGGGFGGRDWPILSAQDVSLHDF
ncbi:hypothetical protein MGU_11521 [Metarhizium guizhouense ARSEF 977]|uniref:Uncharacterized protein n=1 Tax=Metarhizium guizhouense (strain ARSEF 977) TaxID=1276136 RepID=A0A0B4GF74_METGA|nr:hypothetical protein MGU_11521 [Metarhizium guizhouense ARSEF 977]